MATPGLRETATGQASVLFALAGTLGLLREALLTDGHVRVAPIAVNVGALGCAVAIRLAPWSRWRHRTSIVLAPLALTLMALGEILEPGAVSQYGIWFVVVFAWIGFWHAPRMPLRIAPFGVVAYLAPFVTTGSPPSDAIAAVAVAVPAAAILGEVLAAKMNLIRRSQRELAETRALLEQANLTDDLTGLGNRRRANVLLDSLQPGDGLLLLDLDHFKQINDTMGHTEGDRVLAALGQYLAAAVRGADTVARYGGEEFLVLLRHAHDAGAAGQRLIDGWLPYGQGVTFSVGAAVHRDGRGPQDTLRAADGALYQAKANGRDCVVLHTDPPGARPPVSTPPTASRCVPQPAPASP